MTIPSVTTNEQNLGQGEIAGPEKKMIYILKGASGDINLDTLVSLDSQTDLKEVMVEGTRYFDLMEAAQVAGGQKWKAWLYAMEDPKLFGPVLDTYVPLYEPEGFCLIDPFLITATGAVMKTAIEAIQSQIVSFHNTYALECFCVLEFPDKEPANSWTQFQTKLDSAIGAVVAKDILVVPNLHKINAGAVSGRLCHSGISIADGLHRVMSGAILGLQEPQAGLTGSVLKDIANARCVVPFSFANFEGVYWSKSITLDAAGGDYQALENLRVIKKIARNIRIKGIYNIGNREFNDSAESIDKNQTDFMDVLKDMAEPTPEVGEIRQPKPGAIKIVWTTTTKVKVYVKAQPFNSPDDIEFNLSLDLSKT